MGTAERAGDPVNSPVLDSVRTGPTVLRVLLGARLRRLREASGISREDAGEAIRASHSKISRLELGRTGFKARDVADLLSLYDVHDDAERETMLALAKQANAPAWWHGYSDVVPHWFESYLGLEQAAHLIRIYDTQRVPDLLQTPDYARAVLRRGHQDTLSAGNERRVALRMQRQQLLHRPNGPRLWAVLDEAALRRPIGDTETMRHQLRHLIKLSNLPSVTIQVMPLCANGHVTNGGPITLLRFREHELPDVVYLEQLTGALYLDKTADFDHYSYVMNSLAIGAEGPGATVLLLRRILEEI